MNNQNAFTRLSNLFSLLCSPQEDATIENISNSLEIPTSIVKEDLTTLFRNNAFSNSVLDGISISACDFGFPMDTAPMYISHNEKALLKNYYPNFLLNSSIDSPYVIKESPTHLSLDLSNLCSKIQSAIDNQYHLKISYRERATGDIVTYEIEPQLLYHNINDGRIYLIHYTDKLFAFRLDYILSIQALKTVKNTTSIPRDIIKIFDYLWGMDFQSNANPVHVKLRIDAFSKNLIQKIKSDTSRRKHGTLYQDNQYWYYEDDVIGINAFRSWINQFGYSVVVLEPSSLAQEIYNSAPIRLRNYEANSFTE